MRIFLTFIAVALVTALAVALAAPPLIDWSARREMVGRAIALRIGAPVKIAGPITLRLLPTPYLEIADVAIGPRGAPWLKGPAMRFEFGFSSLFGGKIELDDVDLDHPQIRLGPRLAPPAEGRLDFEHIRVRHAEARIDRADAAPIEIHDLDFEGSARSGRGPWRGGGDFALGGARANFQLASETFAADALPLKAEIDSGTTRVDFDGRLVLSEAPSLEGTAILAGEAASPDGRNWPWRIEGALAANEKSASIADAEARLGDEARSLDAEGRLTLQFGARPALAADLTAKTLNIDALLRADRETFAPPSRAFGAFAALTERAFRRNAPLGKFSLNIRAETAYLGARTLSGPEIALSGAPDGPMRLALASALPGGGRVKLDGDLELGAAPIFRGRAEGEVGEFANLAAWIAEGDPALADRLDALQAALPAGAISAAGDVELSPEGYSVRDLDLDVASTRFDGGVVYQLPAAGNRARLYLDLSSDALDIETAPDVEAGLAWLGDTDLDFRLKADSLRVARVGLASVKSGSLIVRAKKDGAKFTLEQLSLADLGGASIEAEGETSPSGRWTRIKLDAGRLGDFAALLARAAPSALTRWLQDRAEVLGAAKATFEARRDGPPLEGPFALDFLKANGEIAGARFNVTLSRAPAPVDAISAQASFDAPDAGALLRRLGAKIPVGPPGRAQLSLTATGQWRRGFDGKASLNLAGAQLDWSGALHPTAEDGAPWFAGPLKLKSADLFPALAALGVATAGTGLAAAADLGGDLEAGAAGARLDRIAGALAGSRVSGSLAFAPPRDTLSLDQLVALSQNAEAADRPAPAAITGALDFDHASLGALLSLALGRPGPTRPGALWSESKFGPALLSPPGADVDIKIGALDLGFGVARSMSGRLRLDRDRLALDDVALLLNGGEAGGRLSLRRAKSQTTASGALSFRGVGVERSALRARLDGGLDFVGSGGSAAALVSGLAGAGNVRLVEAKWPRLDPEGFGRAFDRIEKAAGPPLDEKRLAGLIGPELDKGALTLTGAAGALALNSGALRFGPLDAPVRGGSASVAGVFNLADLGLSLEATLTHAKVGRFWSGPPPSVTVEAKAEPPTRKIDVAMLAAGLAAEGIARESDRIANFEADVRERAYFNRVRKAWLFLDRRAAEIAAFKADQARRRLMDHYLGPYAEWARSHREALPAPRAGAPNGRETARNSAETGL